MQTSSVSNERVLDFARPRYTLALAITMHGDNNFYAGLSGDVAEGGIFIATHHLLPIGTRVLMAFTLPGRPEPIRVLGSVQWIRSQTALAEETNIFGGELPGVKQGVGVEFEWLDDEARRAVRAFAVRRSPELFD